LLILTLIDHFLHNFLFSRIQPHRSIIFGTMYVWLSFFAYSSRHHPSDQILFFRSFAYILHENQTLIKFFCKNSFFIKRSIYIVSDRGYFQLFQHLPRGSFGSFSLYGHLLGIEIINLF
jgi:hypothetical protein